MRNLQELYSERVEDFLRTCEMRRTISYIVVGRRPRPQEYREFPYREKVELMPSRSWGYSPYWEGENCVVRSLCMVHKMFPYMSMRIDHVRPVGMFLRLSGSSIGLVGRRTRQFHLDPSA